MRIVILGLILMAICISPSQSQDYSTLKFEFECDGENSTMSTYAYVKEPSLQDSGYTRGLKTGSFNYLEEGDVHYKETINHKYGNGTSNKSARIEHILLVDFNGTKGISEFYGKGFFRNNRAISAWKKIRYENLARHENVTYKNVTYTLGKPRTANEIHVDASVKMETGTGWEKYNLDYNATIADGVIETKDAAGWSNRTGARRLDFEHDTLISGDKFTVTNKLSDSAPFQTEAGGGDWLSCCIGGTTPPYYPKIDSWTGCEDGSCTPEGEWPNEGTWGTLAPAKKLPNATRIQNCTLNPDTGELICDDPTYSNFSCNDTKCTGFKCIYDFSGVDTREEELAELFGTYSSIDVDQTIETDADYISTEMSSYAEESFNITTPDYNNDTIVLYDIVIANSGKTKLTTVTANVTLPAGMKYHDGVLIDEDDDLKYLRDLDLFSTQKLEDNRTRIIFSIGDLPTDSDNWVSLFIKHRTGEVDQVDYYGSEVRVCGSDPGGNETCQTAERPT